MSLQQIPVSRRTGCERLHADRQPVEGSHDLLEFWRWIGSDLVDNTQRGIFAEFIVGIAVGDISIANGVRDGWGNYDLTSSSGAKIEVKSAAYVQTWYQEKESSISFNISKKLSWDPATDQYSEKPTRPADVYVFCLLTHRAADSVENLDPLNVMQWEFYVLSTSILDRHLPERQSIGLESLKTIGAKHVRFENLGSAVNEAFCGKA